MAAWAKIEGQADATFTILDHAVRYSGEACPWEKLHVSSFPNGEQGACRQVPGELVAS